MVTTLLDQGISVVVVNAATAVGLASSIPFGVGPSISRDPIQAVFSCTGTYSVCTAQLQQTLDGGATWQNVGAVVDLYANQAGSLTLFFSVAALIPGPSYQLEIVTITGTSITVTLMAS